MSVLPIVKQPNTILRLKAKEVKSADIRSPQIKKLVGDMIETMRKVGGIGIAAPQVGVSLKIFAADIGDGPIVLFNPKIARHSWRTVQSEEGCLSVPEIFGVVKRFRSVTVKGLNQDGEPSKIAASDLLAIVFQHEIDHLNGILFVDKVIKYIAPSKTQI